MVSALEHGKKKCSSYMMLTKLCIHLSHSTMINMLHKYFNLWAGPGVVIGMQKKGTLFFGVEQLPPREGNNKTPKPPSVSFRFFFKTRFDQNFFVEKQGRCTSWMGVFRFFFFFCVPLWENFFQGNKRQKEVPAKFVQLACFDCMCHDHLNSLTANPLTTACSSLLTFLPA